MAREAPWNQEIGSPDKVGQRQETVPTQPLCSQLEAPKWSLGGISVREGYTAREVPLRDRDNLHRTSLQNELVWGWEGGSVVKELATQL